MTSTATALLGLADLGQYLSLPADDESAIAGRLSHLASKVWERPIVAASVSACDANYNFASPATHRLLHVTVTEADGTTVPLFCKVLHHLRHWPTLALMPPPVADTFLRLFPWREELSMWSEPFASGVPSGLRTPRLGEVIDLGDDRLAVWMEDVATTSTPWDLGRFALAAHLLGQLAGQLSSPEALASNGYETGYGLRMYVDNYLKQRALGCLHDDDLWARPVVRDHLDVRRELIALGATVDKLRARLDALPQSLPHGDASPQNILVPPDPAAPMVLIDLGFYTPHAMGFDLSQLLIGLVHAGELPPSALPKIDRVIVPAFCEGLHRSGIATARRSTTAQVDEAHALTLLLRSGFDAPVFASMQGPGAEAAIESRFEVARFILQRSRPFLDG